MKGEIDLKLRPLKLAFLVSPGDSLGLARAIELNSTLWGGSYNPIIPTFERVPKSWRKRKEAFGYTGRKILRGYIEAFDPDFLVPLGKCKKLKFEEFGREVIDDKKIELSTRDWTPGYGVGVFEVLTGIYKKDFKFKRRYPIEVIFPVLPRQNKNFFRAVFGSPPKETTEQIIENWKESLGAEVLPVNFENYISKVLPLNIRKILNFSIESNRNFGFQHGECVFLMDASNNQDIIDFWNLRAIGWTVLPVAIQSLGFNSTSKIVSDFIEEHSGVSRHNKELYFRCPILKSRSLDDEIEKEFVKTLKIKDEDEAKGSRFVIQPWYPRVWDEWARDKDGVVCCDLDAGRASHDLDNCNESIKVRTPYPEFASRFSEHDSPRFAIEVVTTNYCRDDIYAEVIPEGGENLSRTLSDTSIDEWRFSKRAASYLARHRDGLLFIKVPKAEEVFVSWMEDKGFKIKLSAPGRIAKQMIKQLGGVHGVNVLANEQMIELLKKMESGREMDRHEFMSEINKIANTSTYRQEGSKLLENHLKKKIFKLGVKIQCPVCSHNSWFDLESFKYQVQCLNCLEKFDVPSHSPDTIFWSYKTIGPFHLPKRAEGVFSTLLTLRVFSALLRNNQITPMMSFETKVDEQPVEVDLGLFYRENRYGTNKGSRLILAECKSGNNFEKKDIEKMKKLADKFPGAVIIFSTLKEELSEKEIKLLKPLANRCRRYYKNQEPYNPLMILTKTELFANIDLTYAWKKKGGKHAQFENRHFYQNELLGICDVTQQLYLGMEPWQTYVNEKFEAGRKKKNPSNDPPKV
jgi:hypothetical protein